ncbi:bifunctional [glutamate--ammonia ligase]-adenylyl-L-tyrosine phosphorylase/[glutamate--ammonia-ligase] adenylyltransferase [Sulfurivermis fontis]|uniref:bifunctional [glutamate--ammonia ligase]-adenylyl-L-tyrosine phosphorylase/[glutamate--ammonia-ligase] adenylyltransferase n=1 Tax=Sulfurivermis fontis TaxID=1972068 RepID=UPI001E46BF20|nr:bifunctional [glutamate--ammonia ligase]-adenylyl-L-tyrosine phosphorylase/[glutamate--ammonia-ligase] adenylyltransferase [Sulfurivermis fontis]
MTPEQSISDALRAIPQPLQERVQRQWQSLSESSPELALAPEFLAELARVWACSEFVADACVRYPDMLQDLLGSGDLRRSYPRGHYRARLSAVLADVADEMQLGVLLRRFRRREMVRIAWRDLAGYSELNEVVTDLSALADACIDLALDHLYRWHCLQWGTPCNADGVPQRLVVLGMGKLGAQELNFSSDVDLIYAYPEDGETRDGRRSLSNQEFFIRLGQRLGNVLSSITAEGYVFRVDTRLRPFGESSALALSFDAMEDYYQVHGREWERYAMIKARVVAGDQEAGAELMAMLKPFVYRRYVDYGAFQSLREMKAMIGREVQRKGMEDNVKLGAGGIREVEFIGQAFQLIRGGREPTLQVRRILTVLEALRGFGWLPDFVVDELTESYIFLRNTEHRIQEYQDRQTHALPEDETGRLRLAWSMGYDSWAAFETVLRDHMRRVHEHFEQVFAAPQTEHAESDSLDLTGVWQGNLDQEQACQALAQAGYGDTAEVYRLVQQVRQGRAFLSLSAQGRTRMNQLMPLLLGAVGQGEQPDITLGRLLHLVETIARRSSYLALLVENPMALSQLVRLCGASPWIASQLAHYPLLLDELLDPRTLYVPPRRKELSNELRQRMMYVAPDDQEAQMDALRHFKQANTLRVAAADVMEAVPLMVVSDHLTELAEVLLDETLTLAWRHLVARHGRPACGEGRACDTGFAIIAYGKLGGIELGYGSDLDIVFLHSNESEGRQTFGDKPVENAVFYARLAQRIIHILGTRTPAGVLYEVDTRLRPSGASGLLVSGLAAFATYQASEAWTWEHQALVRARGVAGDPAVLESFEAIRRQILGRPREREKLRQEVREMRERMRSQLAKGGADKFDLKQDAGGIADIEFMVQYGVLAWAHEHPALLDFTDNIRLLERLAQAGRLPPADAALLADAYRAYRAQVHRLTLLEQPTLVESGEFDALRAQVIRIWRELME